MSEKAESASRGNAKGRLRRVLRDEVDGKRTCVLVLGDGANRQAKHQPLDRRSEWQRLLEAIWCEAGGRRRDFAEVKQSSSAAWAMVIAQWAACHRVSAARAEDAVRRRVCALFAPIEAAAKRRRLYTKLLDGRFANVISFSIDRCLLLQSGARRIVARHPKGPFLRRHFEVSGAKGMTRVWFPYGATSWASSIHPGYSMFDVRLMDLETARASLMDQYNAYHYGYGPGLRPPTYIYGERWHAPESWSELVLCAPLVFVGASLPADDWPLWWLLHQRARYFIPFKDWEIAETFYLTSRPAEAGHVLNGAAGLETISFRNDDELWRFVISALDARGVDFDPGMDR
jgi:hypothetical protein